MATSYTVSCPHQASRKIQHGSVIYATGTLPLELKSYDDAFNSEIWAKHHQPFSAVIIHDSGTELMLVRDHLGLEPLYFTQQNDSVYVASNLPALFDLLPKTPSFDEQELTRLFSTSHDYSDNTLYQNVFRVEPGHFIHFRRNASLTKKPFWTLKPHGESLIYQDSQEYVEHFSMLLKEAITETIPTHASIAGEFSAGLDSTAVYCAAHERGLRPKLFMHSAPKDSDAERRYQTRYETAFLEAYPEVNIERVQAKNLDILSIFDEYAAWFKGPAPYLFFMFANPIHRAVSQQGYNILLSGFGGDQGVSSPMPPNFFIPELIAQKNYKEAWEEVMRPSLKKGTLGKLKALLTYSTYLHPKIHQSSLFAKKMRAEFHNLLHRNENQIVTSPHPYTRTNYKTVREGEHALLQGQDSHEIRMRIEYSSIVSKNMGFEYRYPLLYPKLLEFFLSIPLSEKRHERSGRYLIRRYLKQFIPNDIFSQYLKREGLDIVPATMTHYQNQFAKGEYTQAFQNLPYEHLITHTSYPIRLRHSIKGYMLRPFHSPQ